MSDLQRGGDTKAVDGPAGGRQQARLAAAMSGVMREWLAANPRLLSRDPAQTGPLVRQFLRIYVERPVPENAGGSRFNACAWLYVLTRLLEPRLVIESGTHRGQSAWIFRVAAPGADVVTFDISHEQLQARLHGIDYRVGDWSDAEIQVREPERTLVFFDDHVDQARRVREAWDRGFRWLIFDDNLPAHTLFATGRPPAPTISMLYDKTLRDGEMLTWTRHGRLRSLEVDAAACAAARRLIEGWSVLPDLRSVTGCRPQLGLTLVRLTEKPEPPP